jgi:hypothetical protein
MAYRFGADMPRMRGGGGSPVHQKDRTDWMALILILAVFAALLIGILAIGTDLELTFLNRR